MALRLDEPWQVKAACRGSAAWDFFPPPSPERRRDKEDREARAKAICMACPVREPCQDFAIRNREPHGIWGGLTEMERRLRW